jgi:serine/threonine protein kinase
VGTAEYISPEVIADKPAEFGTDIWAFGVMLYQMIFNTTPFKDQSAYLTFRKIESAKVKYPTDSNNISDEAKDFAS